MRATSSRSGTSAAAEWGSGRPASSLGRSTARNHERQSAPIDDRGERDEPDDAELQPHVEPGVVRLQVRRRRCARRGRRTARPTAASSRPSPSRTTAAARARPITAFQMSRRPVRSSLLPKRSSSAFQNTSSRVTDATSAPAAAQYTPRRRSGPTRRAQRANPRATSTITPTRITVADRVRSMTVPATTSQPMPCARRMLPAASSDAEDDQAEQRDHAEQVAVGDDALDGPALEEQPARPVERHRRVSSP